MPRSSRIAAAIGLLAVFIVLGFVLRAERQTTSSQDGDTIVTVREIAERPEAYFIVDIRESEEYDQGHFEGSAHVPLGTFLSDEKARDQVLASAGGRQIVIFCHSGVRSRIAAEALEQKDVLQVTKGFEQVQSGAGGDLWVGSRTHSLPSAFRNELAQREFILQDLPEGAQLVDLTWNQYYSDDERVLAAPMMRLSEEENGEIVSALHDKKFVGLCNSNLSCFYAKILGYRAEERGGTFMGFIVSREFEERIAPHTEQGATSTN